MDVYMDETCQSACTSVFTWCVFLDVSLSDACHALSTLRVSLKVHSPIFSAPFFVLEEDSICLSPISRAHLPDLLLAFYLSVIDKLVGNRISARESLFYIWECALSS